MSDSRAIGVFDSGLGGLTVAKRIMEIMPNESIVYFGDTGRVPYGTKGVETIRRYALEDERFLMGKDVKMIVAACGTVSSVAADTGESLPVPFIEVISHSVKTAVAVSENKKIGVIATPVTIKSHAHKDLIMSACETAQVFEKAAPMLVSLAEEGWFGTDNEIARLTLKEYLADMKSEGIDTLILGCTHFPVFYDLISEYLPGVTLIDMGTAAAQYIKATLKEKNMESESAPEYKFFVSDKSVTTQKVAKIFLNERAGDIEINQVNIEKQ